MKMIELYRRIVLRNAENGVVYDSGLVPCKSYVKQFLELAEGFLKKIQKDGKDVNGDIVNLVTTTGIGMNNNGRVDAGVGEDTHGVVVGTNAGSTPEDNVNYKLDTKILHSGTGEAGKLNYQSVTFVAPHESGGYVDYDISRAFINETSGNISVKEIGIICKNYVVTKYHLLLRDVVSEQVVAPAETVTVVYTLRTQA